MEENKDNSLKKLSPKKSINRKFPHRGQKFKQHFVSAICEKEQTISKKPSTNNKEENLKSNTQEDLSLIPPIKKLKYETEIEITDSSKTEKTINSPKKEEINPSKKGEEENKKEEINSSKKEEEENKNKEINSLFKKEEEEENKKEKENKKEEEIPKTENFLLQNKKPKKPSLDEYYQMNSDLIEILESKPEEEEEIIETPSTLMHDIIQMRNDQLKLLEILIEKGKEKINSKKNLDEMKLINQMIPITVSIISNSKIKDKEALLKALYAAIKKKTDLFFSVDKDIHMYGSKERKTRSMTEETRSQETEKERKSLASAGYGEITKGCFKKLISGFLSEIPEHLRPIKNNSTFLDIGSGFGKCVFHSSLTFPFVRVVGIEIVKNRYLLSQEILNDFQMLSLDIKKMLNLEAVEFFCGDVTKWAPEKISEFSHLYSFDPVFSEETLTNLIQLLERSEWTVWATCCPDTKLRKLGGKNFELVHKIQGIHTTGHESFSFYYYTKKKIEW